MKLAPSVLACAWLLLAACETQLDLGRNASPDAGPSPSDDDDDDGDDAAAASTGDAGSGDYSCERVCARLIACSGVEPDEGPRCVAECNAGSNAGDRACAMNAPCAAIAETCGRAPTDDPTSDDEFEIQVCQNSCDTAHFRECIDATEHSTCRALCASSAAAPREAFTACTDTGGQCDRIADCYATFAN